MLLAFSVAPLGSGESVAEAVADAIAVVRDSGLDYHLGSMFTTIEGEWDEVFATVRRATDAVAAHGHRISLTMKADIRPGHDREVTGNGERGDRVLAERDSGSQSAGRGAQQRHAPRRRIRVRGGLHEPDGA